LQIHDSTTLADLRKSWVAFAIVALAILCGAFFMVWEFVARGVEGLSRFESICLAGVAALGPIGIVLGIWASFGVELTHEGISTRNLLFAKRFLPWSQVESVKLGNRVVVQGSGKTIRFNPYVFRDRARMIDFLTDCLSRIGKTGPKE
jgi:hypothetical protein